MKDKIAQLKISNISKLCPYDKIRLDNWLKEIRKSIKEEPEKYSDKCQFNLMK